VITRPPPRPADALGVRNVRFRQVDAEVIDEDAASLDGVLCRWGYMLMSDPAAALKQTRRVLRPGGRLVLAAWTGPEENRWSSVPSRELVRRGLLEPPDPDPPGQFAWAEEGAVAEQLEAAGFVDFEVAAVDFTMSYASARDWWDATRALSMRFDDAVAGLDEATADDIRASLAPEGGPLDVPARTWVAAATG
jgi:SAM-dependent methyltransferase